MRGVRALLAITGVIDHQHALSMRRRGRIPEQQLQTTSIDGLNIPVGLRQEERQALDSRGLGTDDRFDTDERGQRLVAIAG